jgi:hypothetical protein
VLKEYRTSDTTYMILLLESTFIAVNKGIIVCIHHWGCFCYTQEGMLRPFRESNSLPLINKIQYFPWKKMLQSQQSYFSQEIISYRPSSNCKNFSNPLERIRAIVNHIWRSSIVKESVSFHANVILCKHFLIVSANLCIFILLAQQMLL